MTTPLDSAYTPTIVPIAGATLDAGTSCALDRVPVVLNAPPPTAGTLRVNTLAESVVILLALTGLQRVVGFVRAVLFCRWLTPEQLGQWDMAFGFLMLAGPLAVLALSGSFGRYVEHYRRMEKFQTMLRKTALFCMAMAVVGVAVLLVGRPWFSNLIFGTADHGDLVAALALSMVGVVLFNYLNDLFSGLRNARAVARLQMVNGMAFAALSLGLLAFWQCDVWSVVVAYGLACVVSAAASGGALRKIWTAHADDPRPLPARDLWSKLLPFAMWTWVTSFLMNLFDVADRYMIIHWSRFSPDEALQQVGNYHSSRVMPLLLISVTGVLSTIVTPYVSHDWEAGRRQRVVTRLNLLMKLAGMMLLLTGVAVVWVAPWVFDLAFRGKFADGLAVLPWTLAYCTWFALASIAQNYLWCAEKARLGAVAVLVGLIVNVGLNVILLPRWGLKGAVVATAAANFVDVLLLIALSRPYGFRIDRGTWLLILAPPVLCLGAVGTTVAVALLLGAALATNLIFNTDERDQLVIGGKEYWRRLRQRAAPPQTA